MDAIVLKSIPEGCDSFITISKGMSGYFAVQMWLNKEEKDLGPFWEPWDTGFLRYHTQEAALSEANSWAISEDIPLILS